MKHAPKDHAQELELESGIKYHDKTTLAQLKAKFDQLDAMYTAKAADEWKMRVAYIQKRREV